jgi:Uncharacterized conserved protein
MNKAVEILRKCNVFHIATTEGDQPRVRPFGAVADIDSKLYISTSNEKKCFKQMIENPKVEISAMLGEDSWVRIAGTLKHDPRMSSKEEFLRQFPLEMHKADDGLFEVLYFEKAIMTIYTYTGAPEVYNL